MEFPKPRIVFQNQTMMETTKKITKQLENLENCEKIANAFEQYGWDAGQIFSMSPSELHNYVAKIVGKVYDQDYSELFEKTILYQKMWDKISTKLYAVLEKLFEFRFGAEQFMIANVSLSPVIGYDENANTFDGCYKKDAEDNFADWIVMLIEVLWNKKVAEIVKTLGFERNPKVDKIMCKYLTHFAFTTTDIKKYISKSVEILPEGYADIVADGIKLRQHLRNNLKNGIFHFVQNGYELIAINLDLFED